MFNNYAIVQSVDKIVPVDMYVPGLPAAARAADRGDRPPARGGTRRRAAGVRGAERRVVSECDEVPGLVEEIERHRRDDLVVEPRAAGRRRDAPARRGGLQLPLRPHRGRLPRLGRRGASPGYIGTPAGRDLNTPMTQGYQAMPLAEAEAVRDQLPPALRSRDRPRRVRLQTWVDEGEPVPTRDPRSGRRPTGTSARRAT